MRSYGGVDCGQLGVAQDIAGTTTTAASTAFGSQTRAVRVSTTAAVRYRVGDGTPTAVTTDTLLPATWVDIVRVVPGQKLACITSSGAATVNVTELVN
jgi:hypothetical protein